MTAAAVPPAVTAGLFGCHSWHAAAVVPGLLRLHAASSSTTRLAAGAPCRHAAPIEDRAVAKDGVQGKGRRPVVAASRRGSVLLVLGWVRRDR